MNALRPYQSAALERVWAAFDVLDKSVLMVMPTGCGKTRTAVAACAREVSRGGVPLFVAPRRELVAQASGALASAGLEPGHDVFVRTIQELSTARADIPNASMVVLDEARHYVADAWSRLRERLPDAVYLGLDATPERGDGRGLGAMFDVIVEAIDVKTAIAQGHLVPCETLRPAHPLGPRELAQDPFNAYWDHALYSRAVVFAPSVEQAKAYAADFYRRGIPAAAIWGDMPVAERDNALELYAEGKLLVLCNVQILTEGWDAPATEAVIFARHFGTAGAMLQAAGRGLRPAEGKTRCLLLDLVGATHVHGEVDDARTWHLEGKAIRRASEGPDVRFCPVCGNIVDGPSCAECNYAGKMRQRKPRVLGLPIDRFAREHAMTDEEAAKGLRSLYAAARKRGFRPTWAVKVWEHKYGRQVTPEIRRMAQESR